MHCKGDHVPTRRPLLAVTGPPRQSGLSRVSWPLAGLQRPRPLRFVQVKHLRTEPVSPSGRAVLS